MLPHLMFNETEMLAFALVLVRVSSFIITWPVFSVYNVPQPLKILLAVTISTVIFPVISRAGLSGEELSTSLLVLVFKELFVGLAIGFLTRLFFFAVNIGGNLIATSIGLANAQVFNPTMGSSGTTVDQFYATIATLIFLGINGHHSLLTGLVHSFDAIPLSLSGTEFALLIDKGKESGAILQLVTVCGIKISAPIMVAMFFMNVAMGILGRAVPQINVLVTSMAVNFMTGLVVMIVAMPALVLEMSQEIMLFAEELFKWMKT